MFSIFNHLENKKFECVLELHVLEPSAVEQHSGEMFYSRLSTSRSHYTLHWMLYTGCNMHLLPYN